MNMMMVQLNVMQNGRPDRETNEISLKRQCVHINDVTPSENVEVVGFEMILEDTHSQDVVQMDALAKHPHEHRRDAEL